MVDSYINGYINSSYQPMTDIVSFKTLAVIHGTTLTYNLSLDGVIIPFITGSWAITVDTLKYPEIK